MTTGFWHALVSAISTERARLAFVHAHPPSGNPVIFTRTPGTPSENAVGPQKEFQSKKTYRLITKVFALSSCTPFEACAGKGSAKSRGLATRF